jgi:hypothetical protein
VLSNESSALHDTLAALHGSSEVILSSLVYLGAGATLLGLALLSPWAAGIGLAAVLLAFAWPATALERRGGETRLDEFLPTSHFHEVHSIRIDATPGRVWRSIHEVTASEIRLFILLTWIRSPRLSRRRKASILDPPPREPILDVALRSGFVLLAESEGREIVIGAVLQGGGFRLPVGSGEFRELSAKGLAKTAMSFRLVEESPGKRRLTTETRVFATDPRTSRLFALYWRLIYPGSALIRRTWLAAIRRRAQGAR